PSSSCPLGGVRPRANRAPYRLDRRWAAFAILRGAHLTPADPTPPTPTPVTALPPPTLRPRSSSSSLPPADGRRDVPLRRSRLRYARPEVRVRRGDSLAPAR